MHTIRLYAALGLVVVFVGVLFLPVLEAGTRQEEYTGNIGQITAQAVIGQTFRATHDKLAGVAVRFATYSGRNNTERVLFGLREWPDAGRDIRVSEVMPQTLGDNQLYRFTFEPVADSAGNTYFFYVRSPGGYEGNAVTVDISSEDPYPAGTAFVVRGDWEDLRQEDIERSGKSGLDVSFVAYHQTPFFLAARHFVSQQIRFFMQTWDEKRSEYVVWLQALLPSLLIVALLLVKRWPVQDAAWSRQFTVMTLLLLGAAGIISRVWLATVLPITNDEGNYLYDAWVLREGKLAGGDGYVKALLPVMWVSVWQSVFGHNVFAGRLASILASVATLYPLYFLSTTLAGRKAGIMAAALWSLLGVSVVFGVYVHTQPVAILFLVSGMAILARTLSPEMQLRSWQLLLGGFFLGLGVASRKSVLAAGLAVAALIVFYRASWRARARVTVIIGFGFAVAISLLLLFGYVAYGVEGVWEAIGFNSASDGISAVEESQEEQVRAYSIRGITPFFREALPLVLLGILGLGLMLERLTSAGTLLAKLGWVAPLIIFYWAWGFFAEHERGDYMVFGMTTIWYCMLFIIWLLALWPRSAANFPRVWLPVMLPLLWIGGLVFFYMNWIKFHVNYVGEFLPPLVLLASFGAAHFHSYFTKGHVPAWVGRGVKVATSLLLLWALFVSYYVVIAFPHTGTFTQNAVAEAAAWAREHIPYDEPIFTGAAVVPYASGHSISLDIAHPRWYAYEFVRTNEDRLATFLPPASAMQQAFRDADWFLLDEQTRFSFFMEYEHIEKSVEQHFERMHGIANGSNTLTFYRRIARD